MEVSLETWVQTFLRRQMIMLVIKSKGSYFIVKKSPRDANINNLHCN